MAEGYARIKILKILQYVQSHLILLTRRLFIRIHGSATTFEARC